MKKNKEKYVDDGHTIYNMNVEGMRGHTKKIENKNNIIVSKKENRTLIFAAFKAYIPKLLLVLLCFGLVALMLYFWLTK